MKAIVQTNYGSPDVFDLQEVARPAVGDSGVLLRVHAAAINAGDVFGMRGSPYVARMSVGWPRPKGYIPGFDVAGRVEAVGPGVTRFQVGDEVFGECKGACAEYAVAHANRLALKPTNVTFQQAAAVPTAGVTALRGLRDAGRVKPGQKVLINGASGGVGSFAVQIAKALGAEVTGVCSTRNVDMVRAIGADHVVDYTREDFTTGARRYDLILDQVANHSFSEMREMLTPDGVYILNSGNRGLGFIAKAFLLSLFIRQQGAPYFAAASHADLVVLKELLESDKITPVVDRVYPLSEAREAFRYLAEGHARGKVVIVVNGSGS